MATVILFPNMRESLFQIVMHWHALGYVISNNRKGRLVLVKA